MPHILDVAREINPSVQDQDVSEIPGGYSSRAFVMAGDVPLVLLLAKESGLSVPHYGHAYVVLTLLEKRGYVHAPKPIWLSSNRDAMAITYFEGISGDKAHASSVEYSTEAFALRVIDALLDTANISKEEYVRECVWQNVSPLPPEPLSVAATLYGTEWFATVERSCPDSGLVAWLKPRIEWVVANVSTIDTGTSALVHGDPSNPNFLINAGSFIFIDWDSSRYQTLWAEFLVSYTSNLLDLMRPHREALVTHVATRLGRPRDDFAESVRRYRMISEIFDVNWAALMMSKAASGEIVDTPEKFRIIAHERIAKYEEAFPDRP